MVNHRVLLLLSLLHVASLFDKSHGQDYGANLVYESHSENFDYDENFQIMITRGSEVIVSTLTMDGHAKEITVLISAFGHAFHLDLKLNTYLLAKYYVEKIINKDGVSFNNVNYTDSHCFYLGNVRGQPLSKAAVSTCQGIVGYFSIGNVSYHIEQRSGRLYGDHKVYRTRNDAETIYRNVHDQMSMASLLNHEKHNRRIRRSFEWPKNLDKENKVIEIYVANAWSQYLSQGSSSDAVFQRTKDIVNIASLGFQSLGIYLVLVGSEVWTDSDKISINTANASATLQEWANYRMTSINPYTYNDHGVLITNNTFENTTIIGIAYLNSMCSNRLSASLISDVYIPPIVAAAVMDHGIGVTFGVTSDTTSGNCSCDDPSGYCIMNPSVNTALSSLIWSQCSKDQFETLDTTGIDICLQNVPEYINNFNASSTCGNGIVENGEECDCGNASDRECNKSCCDTTTCLLRSGATCAYGRCCDISTCQVLECDTTCRQMNSDCDLVEVCNGIDGLCPGDTYIHDGTECVVNGVSAYCYNGLCQSRESQCELLWGSGTLVSSDRCYNLLNNHGDLYGDCGINWLPNVTYVPYNSSDVFCGRLQCQDNNKTLHHYFNYFQMTSASIGNDTCHSVIFDFGLATHDPGIVPSGAKCGVDKMCVDQRCVDVDKTSYCSSVCGPDEVCNNLRQCQKIAGSCQKATNPTDTISELTTAFASTREPTTPFPTTTTSTTPIITTTKPTTPVDTTTTPTTPIITTTKHTTPFVITSNLTSPTSLMETSKLSTGAVSTLGVINREISTSASKAASGEITTFDGRFVSTTLQTTTNKFNLCNTLPCINGASCFTDNNNFATCACIAGYRGSLCEEDIAECDSDPCQHDSTCIDGLNNYTCQCLAGYNGRNCETEVNECENSTCPINSTCESSVNRFQCICPNPNEFIGTHCNISVSLPDQSDSPEFIGASPNHGPVSGGTKMIITGRNLEKYDGIFFIYIGNMRLPITNWTR